MVIIVYIKDIVKSESVFCSGRVPHAADIPTPITPLSLAEEDCKHHNSPARAPIEAWRSDSEPVVKNTKKGSHLPPSSKRWKRSCSIC